MSKFIQLPNGDAILADVIVAVRKGAAEGNHKCRVIVDFGVPSTDSIFGQGHINSTVCDCGTNEERDALAEKIIAEIEAS